MNIENIKILRNKISVPLDKALQLLKRNNDDIVLAEQDFHNQNIIEICKMTDCDEKTVRKEYQICDYDLIKTVERINQKPVRIGTGKFLDSKIGFILWPENEIGELYKTAKRNDAFISTDDFDIVIKVFQSVFPIKNSWNNTIENEFDKTGHNFFDNKTCRLIVEKINNLQTADEKETAFLTKLTNWLNNKLGYADCIVVYGNL